MALTTSGVLVENSIDWGADTVIGLPGDGTNGIMEALRTGQDRLDPFEPSMPPKVTLKQTTRFAEALITGQSKGEKIALSLFRDKLNELL